MDTNFANWTVIFPRFEPSKDEYPAVDADEKRFLNSGGFIGPASSVYKIVSMEPILDTDDDQEYYTRIFLQPKLRVSIFCD